MTSWTLSVFMSSFCFPLAKFRICVNCSDDSIIQAIKNVCPSPRLESPDSQYQQLTCDIVDDQDRHRQLEQKLHFNDSMVQVSQGMDIKYQFAGPHTWMKVSHTAIMHIHSGEPEQAQVWLAPPEPNPEDGSPMYRPLPEAFLYPLLVEWIRHFGACMIHCGAVRYAGFTIVLSGPPKSGKSTHVLRLMIKGAEFIADDLGMLYRNEEGVWLSPFREVADVRKDTMARFPELAFLSDAEVRDEDKYTVKVPQYFGEIGAQPAPPGLFLRLYPDEQAWVRPTDPDTVFHGMQNMAYFPGRPDLNLVHFDLLCDWLGDCVQWDVSQGYMAEHLDELLARIAQTLPKSN